MDEKLYKQLYFLERNFLPETFYGEERDLIRALMDHPDIIGNMFRDVCAEHGIDNPYKPEDFKVDFLRFDQIGKRLGACITYPLPEEPGLCLFGYIFFDDAGNDKAMYAATLDAVEKEGENGTERVAGAVMRSFEKDGSTNEFGGFPLDTTTPKTLLDAAYALYCKKTGTVLDVYL